ncbi:hypothetical protein [Fodinibius sediminis]|uniref:Uncharacterized protein n=1 Tax=Fodinibius sediminis TaxID=1214077 RepID=A0A521E162_9BACT|nr:hypothetical protein [Fodinibius sediminis]SMO76850.1 hypothetical protein SAMN06265218_11273 [Fodinibius sediminis]
MASFGTAQAQRILGVVWEIPSDEAQAVQQLETFRKMGITVLEVQKLPSGRLWDEISQHNFTVYGDLNIRFPTAHTLARADSSFYSEINRKVDAFVGHPAVKALKLFSYGAVHDEDFNRAADSLFSSIGPLENTEMYYSGSRASPDPDLPVDFFMLDLHVSPQNVDALPISSSPDPSGYYYHPSPELAHLLTPLKQLFQVTSTHPGDILFLDSRWLLTMTEHHPRLPATLKSQASGEDSIFPTPNEPRPDQHSSPLPIIVLLLGWGILAIHYNMSPIYRKSLFRYFTGHKFFLNDIFHQHIRSPFPALLITTQNALFVAAALFILSRNLWSITGIRGLLHYYPNLLFISGSRYDIFIIALGGTLLYSLACTLWLYLSHQSLRSITQVLTLFAWPLQLNIILGTIVIALYVSGGNATTMASLSAAMLTICLLSFIITARDAAHHLMGKRMRYLGLTIGLYLIAISALAIWVLKFNDPLWQVIDLSLQLK